MPTQSSTAPAYLFRNALTTITEAVRLRLPPLQTKCVRSHLRKVTTTSLLISPPIGSIWRNSLTGVVQETKVFSFVLLQEQSTQLTSTVLKSWAHSSLCPAQSVAATDGLKPCLPKMKTANIHMLSKCMRSPNTSDLTVGSSTRSLTTASALTNGLTLSNVSARQQMRLATPIWKSSGMTPEAHPQSNFSHHTATHRNSLSITTPATRAAMHLNSAAPLPTHITAFMPV